MQTPSNRAEKVKMFGFQLVENRHIYDGLPVKCEQHPQRTAVLKHKEDFVTNCPDGGCSEPWYVKQIFAFRL